MANARRRAGMPGWVKAIGVAVLLFVIIGVAMLAMGHSPMQHFGMHMGG